MSNIIVIGDLIVDRQVSCSVKGFAQEAHNTVMVNALRDSHSLGGVGNVYQNLLALDCFDGVLFSFTGYGPASDKVAKSNLPHPRANVTLAKFERGDVCLKTRFVTPAGQIFRCDEDCVGTVATGHWNSNAYGAKYFRELMGICTQPLLCLVDYDKGVFADVANVQDIMYQATQAKAHILVDPGRTGDWWKYTSPRTIFKVNVSQANASYDWLVRQVSAGGYRRPSVAYDANDDYGLAVCRSIGERVQHNLQRSELAYKAVVLTCGSSGIVLIEPRKEPVAICTRRNTHVVDTLGAGDVVLSTLAYCLTRSGFDYSTDEMVNACDKADRAARLAVGHRGCYAPTWKEIINYV